MRNSWRAILAAMVLGASTPIAGAQPAMPSGAPAAGPLPHIALTADALTGLPRRTVDVVGEDGTAAVYSGVDVGALLAKNGAPHWPALRGAAAADYALVVAADGYRAVFALAELDPAVTDKIVIVADTRDGKPLDARNGPFQIIAPDEKHRLRWVRNVREIDVAAAP